MPTLRIQKLNNITTADLCDGAALIGKLATVGWNDLAHCPWEGQFPYKPDVRFQIAHDDDRIYLHYEVKEEYVKAQYIRPNGNVWEDSCIEFFISLDDRQSYYNFEFNVIGTGLIGYGTEDKSARLRLAAEQIERIDTFTQVSKVNGTKVWRIVLVIPKDIFSEGIASSQTFHANFYKCGDALPQPHFLVWNNIENPTPNFHLPRYFGEVVFEG